MALKYGKSPIRLSAFIPSKYRSLASVIGLFLTTWVIAFLVIVLAAAANASVDKIISKYFVAMAASFIFLVAAVCSAILDLKQTSHAKRIAAKIEDEAAATLSSITSQNEKSLAKIVRLISTGRLAAKLDPAADSIVPCDKAMPLEEMLPPGVLAKERKTLMRNNFIAFGALVVAWIINLYYVLDSAVFSKNTVAGLFKGLGAAFVASVFILQISALAYYLPAKIFKDGKKAKINGSRFGTIFAILTIVSALLWIVLIIILVKNNVNA